MNGIRGYRARTSVRTSLLILCLCGFAQAATPATQPATSGRPSFSVDDPPKGIFADDWYAIMLNERKSGHMHSTMERIKEGTLDVIRSRTYMEMAAGREGATIKVSVTQESRESLAGVPLGFKHTMKLGMIPTETSGTIRDGKVIVTTSQFGQQGQTATYRLPEGAKMSWAMYKEELKHGLKPGTKYQVSMYEPSMALNRLTPATVEVLGREKIDLFGRKVDAIRTKQTMTIKALLGQDMEMETVTWVDEDGTPLRIQMSMMNIPIEMVACPKSIATAKDDPGDLMENALVPVKGRIDHNAGRITYRITTKDGKGKLGNLPQTGLQSVRMAGPGEAIVTVTRFSAKTHKPERVTLSPKQRETFLAAAPLVNYKDPEVAKLAREAAGDEKDPRKLADKLRKFVGDYITEKNLSVGFASASEVARSREGDCTEHAVLLAALGRAAGIPTRVATGLVYADSFGGQQRTFVGHMWTQFYLDNQWVDVDAALRQTDVDATHIALDVNAAGDTGLADLVGSLWLTMGNLRIEVVQPEAAQPTKPHAAPGR